MKGNIYIKRLVTDEVVRPIEVTATQIRKVDRVVGGILINLNTDEYYVDDSEFDVLMEDEPKEA